MARRTKEEAERTRTTLLETALALFSEKGLSNVTLAQIASAAGVTRGAIYWHFKDKSQMLEALADEVYGPLEHKFLKLFELMPNDPLQALQDLGQQIFKQTVNDHRFRSMCLILQQASFDKQMIVRCRELTSEEDCNMARLMRKAHKEGVLRQDISAEAASLMINGFFQGVIERWLISGGRVDLEQESCVMMAALIDALRAKESP